MTSEHHEKLENSITSPSGTNARPETPVPLNLKSYFDEKLYSHLSAALAACASERPDDPVSFVANFLLSRSEGKRDKEN